jgi:GT2 family glycosyltransferase
VNRPIMLGTLVFREDRRMVEDAIGSFLSPLVDVVVIDNGSTDEAKAGIATHADGIEVIRNPENVYVNPAWNQLAERFLQSDSEILVIANSDVLVRPGWAESLLDRLAGSIAHERAARRYYGTDRPDRAGKELWFGRRVSDIDEARGDPQHSAEEAPPGSSCTRGGFYAMKRAMVPLVFPIPPPLLIWYGDNWIFDILARLGYQEITLRDIVVWHAESVSQNRIPEIGSITWEDQQRWLRWAGQRSRREADSILRGHGRLDPIEARYMELRDEPSDFNEHMPILRAYAERVERATEFGVGRSSWALLHARPKKLRCYDHIDDSRKIGIRQMMELGRAAGIDVDYIIGSSLEIDIEPTDLLFIDTMHTYGQLRQELARHAPKVLRYILLHDTETYGVRGEDGQTPGLEGAVEDFLATDRCWRMRDRLKNNHGLTILERR